MYITIAFLVGIIIGAFASYHYAASTLMTSFYHHSGYKSQLRNDFYDTIENTIDPRYKNIRHVEDMYSAAPRIYNGEFDANMLIERIDGDEAAYREAAQRAAQEKALRYKFLER